MRTKVFTIAALTIVATIVSSIATAGSAASQQRIAVGFQSNSNRFVLTPLTAGPVQADSGKVDSCCWSRRFLTRDGQSIEIDNPTTTFTGKHGTFTWHERVTFVDINNDYTVATGGWTLVKGTGAYAHLTGHGASALVLKTAESRWLASKAEGVVALQP